LRLAAVAIGLLAGMTALACENETGTNRSGRSVYVRMPVEDLRPEISYDARRKALVPWAEAVTRSARKHPGFDTHNELAVALTRLGRPEKAIELLTVLESRYPGRYETATNLGTAYELAGKDAEALQWIREGIRRNPDSHAGSEWIHVRILEAKVAGTVGRGSMLGLDSVNEQLPKQPAGLPGGNDGQPLSPDEVSLHLFAQLAERTQFVPPTDPVVASLFFDWANLELATGSLEVADLAFEFAQRYGHPQKQLIAARRARIAKALGQAQG
jgi:tetratricopeptide (TPR) repeat protein